jgi:tetratricopeptide (TPR) repeat protein
LKKQQTFARIFKEGSKRQTRTQFSGLSTGLQNAFNALLRQRDEQRTVHRHGPFMVTAKDLHERFEALSVDLSAAKGVTSLESIVRFASDATRGGRADLSICLLERVTREHARASGLVWQLLGYAYRDLQAMELAVEALKRAAHLEPENAGIAAANAVLHFETGRKADDLWALAAKLSPGDLNFRRSWAQALAAEGNVSQAKTVLLNALALNPCWVDGHKTLGSLRITSNDPSDPFQSLKDACGLHPDQLALRLAWFHALSGARRWAEATEVVEQGVTLFGHVPGLRVARVFIAAESEPETCPSNVFDSVADIKDPGLDLCHVRFAIRRGDTETAEALCVRNLGTASERLFWPYLSLIWRMTNNPKADWLNSDSLFIKTYDLPFSTNELRDLGTTLRALHIMAAPYLEQSVRGGTQTDRPLFFRNDDAIQNAKSKILVAVESYIDSLPQQDSRHPLLGPDRSEILFSGSWSVRLKKAGYHACHTHPLGWISSAFYVALPAEDDMGTPPGGWLAFGTPPPELGLSMLPQKLIEPKPGRLVLFPSTLWHSTLPFDDGERLSIAFDVARPRQRR